MRDDLNAACAAQPGLMAGIQALLLQHEVEQFYHREAALLDERRFEDWLELLADDLSYWMPVRETRAAGQEAGEFSRPGEGALFDETKALMIVRVRKLRTGFACGGAAFPDPARRQQCACRWKAGRWRIARRKQFRAAPFTAREHAGSLVRLPQGCPAADLRWVSGGAPGNLPGPHSDRQSEPERLF